MPRIFFLMLNIHVNFTAIIENGTVEIGTNHQIIGALAGVTNAVCLDPFRQNPILFFT